MLAKLLLGLLLLSPFTSRAALVESAGAQSTANVSSLTVTFGTAPAQNTIIVFCIQTGANGTGVVTASGFTVVTGLGVVTTPSTGEYFYWLYKVAGASEGTSYVLTPNSSNWMAAQGWVFSGRNTSTPFTAVHSSTIATGSVNALSMPLTGVTAATGDDVLYFAGPGLTGVTNYSFTQPSGFTNSLNTTGGTGSFVVSVMGAVHTNVSSGATGTLTGSLTWTGGNASDGAGAVISLAASSGSCTNNFWQSGGTYAVPNGSSGSYWALSGAFATPNCSTGTYWLKTGAKGAT